MNPRPRHRPTRFSTSSSSVVALGGGHGLSATLQSLQHLTSAITAIVTVADDGGSSGRLRDEFGVLPPGDLRMALTALCDDTDWGQTWRDVLQHRFVSSGPLNYHSLGNLLIVALWEILGDEVDGLAWVARLLGARGQVLPMASVPLKIEADIEFDDGARTVLGQSNVAKTTGHVQEVRLDPHDPPASPQAVQAISEANWIILGPGSWFTSVIPHLLVPGLKDALTNSQAHRALVMNLFPEDGETQGMTSADHLRSFNAHSENFTFDVIIADPSAVDDIDELSEQAEAMGASLMLRQVRSSNNPGIHDPLRLAGALRDAFDNVLGDVDSGATGTT